jgi:hypothetical protein
MFKNKTKGERMRVGKSRKRYAFISKLLQTNKILQVILIAILLLIENTYSEPVAIENVCIDCLVLENQQYYGNPANINATDDRNSK